MSIGRRDVVVIGAGQVGLISGYHLARQGTTFVILDAASRVGESWRSAAMAFQDAALKARRSEQPQRVPPLERRQNTSLANAAGHVREF